MDLNYTAEETQFREEVRSFIRSSLSPAIRSKMQNGQMLEREDIVGWQRILNKKGWAVPLWPQEWGGTGWEPVRQYIFKEEMYAAWAPEPVSMNVAMVGPVLIQFGTQQQKEYFLPRIANLDFWFCQGFSEPNAGSDLASLQTRAVRDGDEYIVTGQKIWTTSAHRADWMFCLVRTDPTAKKQRGISYLLIDMKSPGITVKPIVTIDGSHSVNEVFLDQVRVPTANLIGEENRGWDYAKFLLGNERLLGARIGLSKARLRHAREMARRVRVDGNTLADTSQFRERTASLEIELLALEITNLRVLGDATRQSTSSKQDPKMSVLKLKGSDLQQATAELLLDVAGPHILPRQTEYLLGQTDATIGPEWAATIAPKYLFSRATTIYGGTNEVQRNIIAKSVLGL
ncbi:acyl-CoA dehydrogenase family protein [Comamonadaceae bacterium G21597-S1]|nr:acyl-CoA dehydrogenase family protein [Comamonadaceae bacterium G21597-S1]